MSTEGSGETTSIVLNLPGAPEQTYLFPKPKGHSRSISHGGTPTLAGNLAARPAPLKSALRGHQRAFSHGQIGEGGRPTSGPGHSRAGSRTDFILPPGHRDPMPTSAIPRLESIRQHSRQASRSDSIYTLRRSSVVGPLRRALFWVTGREGPSVDNRHIMVVPNHLVPDKTPKKEHPNGHRSNNQIRTTKYTCLSFIPKNLFEQFHRIANLYFIFIVLLNWVPALNAFGKEVAMVPVLFVLCVTAVKDLFEDRRRHKSDKRINNSVCRVFKKNENQYVEIKWRDLRVGDLVHLSNNESVPADIVLLNSSNPNGVCYLHTCNLDGETNLKQRVVAPGFRGKQFCPGKFKSLIEVERPSTKIYRFNGSISHPDGQRVLISSEHLLLRECFIKNTDYVEGIVVYAGHETKAMLNNGGPRYKCSNLERNMNRDVVWCILVLLFLCCFGAVGCKLWLDRYNTGQRTPPFLPYHLAPAYEGLLIFWTYIIVLQVMIPVSLYVTLELTKLLQVYHIHQSVDLYDPETNIRTECRALNITEELGQIHYLFSDKTGTLTENKMLFRRCAINGIDYDHPPGPPAEPITELPSVVVPMTKISPNRRLLQHITDPPDSVHAQKVREFILVLAICNTVVVTLPHVDNTLKKGAIPVPEICNEDDRQVNGNVSSHVNDNNYARLDESRSTTPSPPPASSSPLRLRIPKLSFGTNRESTSSTLRNTLPPESRFEAESPDELALTEAAFAYGYELRLRTPDDVELGIRGELIRMNVVRIQEFDSSRKCMSVAMRNETGEIVLYVKGADSTVLSALSPIQTGTPEAAVYTRTKDLILDYSRAGLRTLAIGKRILTPREWEEWLAGHIRAATPGDGRDKRIRESLARLESGLTLLGATGVEDKLQEAVPHTVRSLLDAGIIVWVLTGDKPETAINIAYSASLFSQNDRILHLMSRDKDHAESTITQYLLDRNQSGCGRALVVDGRTLTFILDRRSGLVTPFLSLARSCSSVLCCRATPLQKAYIVKAVKEELGVTTLAIGDGANDVSMIQTADVGIGLSGQEGRQAVMASDFALSRFKYIENLLLVHGHWCYDRLARMILYFFLKNATFVFLLFWYQFYSGFSSAVMIDQLHLMSYNLIFTAVPPIAIGAYDRVAPATLLLERPGLYSASRKGLVYKPFSYWGILVEAIYISAVIFFTATYAYWDTDVDVSVFGICNMTACLIIMLLYVAIETRSWTILHIIALVGSVAAFFVLTAMYQSICVSCLKMPSNYWVIHTAFLDPIYWLVIVFSSVASLAPRLAWYAMRNTLWPGALGRAVLARRRSPRTRLPYAAQYHTNSSSAHVYRSTDEDGLQKDTIDVITIT